MARPPAPSTIPHDPTNTLALLLPHPNLFSPPVLSLLRAHYEQFGRIAHWAPVRGFGRVIVVFESEEEAEAAKAEGDWLKLEVPVGGEGSQHGKEEELVLRLLYLPNTELHPDPATTHLAPPPIPHNFLISPPGSPPEGWEPIAEDAPNRNILPEDLQRALEALQLNKGRGDDGKEVILDEGGVRVEVEDTSRHDEVQEGSDDDVEEYVEGGNAAWSLPSQMNGVGTPRGGATPGYGIKMIPTAMPPR
ncbi:hypothetical protein B9479_003656 [Cryptococcus floricola]|uniref:Calcipressin n=1 Tax=Cryptococcus floricola TaxID=2591691 RepID=A0A5D3AYP3_9TREE|nr:hypothetical protein B9479_003656 [Cryptococcus floricola]